MIPDSIAELDVCRSKECVRRTHILSLSSAVLQKESDRTEILEGPETIQALPSEKTAVQKEVVHV